MKTDRYKRRCRCHKTDRKNRGASNAFRRAIIDELKGSRELPDLLFDFASVPRIDSVGIGVLAGLQVSIAQRVGASV